MVHCSQRLYRNPSNLRDEPTESGWVIARVQMRTSLPAWKGVYWKKSYEARNDRKDARYEHLKLSPSFSFRNHSFGLDVL